MNSRFVHIVLLAIAGWTFLPVSIASEPVQFSTLDFEPYAISNGKGNNRGFIVDTNATISERAGIKIVDTVLPISRLMKNLQRGVSDCSIFLLSPWSQARFIAVAEVHDRFDSIIITRKGLRR